MASLSTDSGGLRRILFIAYDGKRKTLRLGRMPLNQARGVMAHVERLAAAAADGSAPPPATGQWVNALNDTLRARLVAVGLVAPKVQPLATTIAQLVDAYKARPRRRELAPKTRENYEACFGRVLSWFGPLTVIDGVTEAAAEDFRGYLLEAKPEGAGLARATANRVCGAASLLFRFARRSRLILDNPFDCVPRGSVATMRRAFVDAATVERLLDFMEDSEWRLLVALARYGGLRCPSEMRGLKWGHVDWANNRFTVTSPKTARHEGHESRVVPLFPELRPYFEERFDEAEEGEELVLPMMGRYVNAAFGSCIRYRLKQMGLDVWPRIFHNLRSTRQTELCERFPGHVVAAWLGNSVAVAERHYLQTTEEHFAKAAQNPAQSTSAKTRTDATTADGKVENTLDSRNVSQAGEDSR